MDKAKFLLLSVVFLAFGWMVLFQAPQPVSSSPLLGITLTPTHVITNTIVAPTKVIHTLPPPPHTVVTPDAPPIIPVTGTDKTANMDGIVNIGLLCLAFGLIAGGLSLRKHKK